VPTPRYMRIAAELRQRIVTGDLKPGDQLPTEAELAEQHRVSRNTVRGALKALTEEGLVLSGQGRGSYVRPPYKPLNWDWSTLESRSRHTSAGDGLDQWEHNVSAQGRQAEQSVEVNIVTPPERVASKLQLGAADLVVVRRRMRYVDGQPYALADSYLPLALVQGTPLMEPRDVSAPGGVLASLGHVQAYYLDSLRSRPPSRDETLRLDLPAATAVLEITRTGYDQDDRPLRVMITVLPGDRNEVSYRVPAE
jgi:DNA-binding GntR family transcriptional regulator